MSFDPGKFSEQLATSMMFDVYEHPILTMHQDVLGGISMQQAGGGMKEAYFGQHKPEYITQENMMQNNRYSEGMFICWASQKRYEFIDSIRKMEEKRGYEVRSEGT